MKCDWADVNLLLDKNFPPENKSGLMLLILHSYNHFYCDLVRLATSPTPNDC